MIKRERDLERRAEKETQRCERCPEIRSRVVRFRGEECDAELSKAAGEERTGRLEGGL